MTNERVVITITKRSTAAFLKLFLFTAHLKKNLTDALKKYISLKVYAMKNLFNVYKI